MSMQVVLLKVSSSLHQKIVAAPSALLAEMGSKAQVADYARDTDANDELDYRDLASWVADTAHPMHHLFEGDALVDDYEWAYGPLTYHDPAQTQELLHRFEACEEDDWQITTVAEFLGRAVSEGKGVILGVT